MADNDHLGDDLPDPAHIATVDVQYDADYGIIALDVVSFDVGAGSEYDIIHNDHSTVYRIARSLYDRWPRVVNDAIIDGSQAVVDAATTARDEVTS